MENTDTDETVEITETAFGQGNPPPSTNLEANNIDIIITALKAADWPVEDFSHDNEKGEKALMRFVMTDPPTLNFWRQLDRRGEDPPIDLGRVVVFGTNRFLRTQGIDHSPVTLSVPERQHEKEFTKGVFADGREFFVRSFDI